MKSVRFVLLSLMMWCSYLSSFAQEQLGLRYENFSGINSVLLNPANNLTSPFNWDVNLIAAGQFVENNYVFLQNTNLIQILKDPSNIVFADDVDELQNNADPLVYDFTSQNKKHFFTSVTNVMGPSFMVNLQSGHSFGLVTNFRSYISAQQLPTNFNYYFLANNAQPGFSFQLAPFNAAGMVWSEIGVNYAYKLETTTGNIGFGTTLKYLQGYEAFYFNSEGSNFTVTDQIGDNFDFENTLVNFGFTNANTDGQNINMQKNGDGFALDLGAIMTIDGYGDAPYKWKFGVAILDIGAIKFNTNAETHEINSADLVSINAADYQNITEIDGLVQQLSQDVFGNPDASSADESFKVWLPGSISLQADYAFNQSFYINATAIQRMSFGKIAIDRGNLLAISPRFEHRWFSASMPVTLYNWQELNLGAAIRLAFLTIGSDNVGSIFGQSKFTGTDFYISLKVNPFNLGLNFDRDKGGRKKKGKVRCYNF